MWRPEPPGNAPCSGFCLMGVFCNKGYVGTRGSCGGRDAGLWSCVSPPGGNTRSSSGGGALRATPRRTSTRHAVVSYSARLDRLFSLDGNGGKPCLSVCALLFVCLRVCVCVCVRSCVLYWSAAAETAPEHDWSSCFDRSSLLRTDAGPPPPRGARSHGCLLRGCCCCCRGAVHCALCSIPLRLIPPLPEAVNIVRAKRIAPAATGPRN